MLKSKYRRSPERGFFIVILSLVGTVALAQDPNGVLDRLQGYVEKGNHYFNADGVSIACIPKPGPFTPKNVADTYRFADLKPKKLKPDPGLNRPNYYEPGEILRAPYLSSTLDYYFLQDSARMISFSFTSTQSIDQEFERAFITLFLDRKIPKEVYQPSDSTEGNFAGRKISLFHGCGWGGATDIRCRYSQLRWSSFQSERQAQLDKENHLKYIEAEGNSIVRKETIDVIFEGMEAKATKLYMSFPNKVGRFYVQPTAMIGYIVVAPVRGKYVTCVVIHRADDTDLINGLPDIAAQVMKL